MIPLQNQTSTRAGPKPQLKWPGTDHPLTLSREIPSPILGAISSPPPPPLNVISRDPVAHFGCYLIPPPSPWPKWPLFRRWHFQTHVLQRNIRISIKISLKFVPKGPIDNNASMAQIMAWSRISDKPFSEPMPTRIADAYASLGGNELIYDTRKRIRNN